MKIKIGTRDSKLAMIQTQMVANAIKKYDENIEIEIIAMKTTGDKILNINLDKIGGKGLFVKELDEALLQKHVDITVHSYKDVPMQVNPKLPIVAVTKREDARDVLLLRKGIDAPFEDMVIGSSSARRVHQLQKLGYKNFVSMRGNLVTRLKKLDDGACDALVLAAAGVLRSGMNERISKVFTTSEIIPAASQGVIAVQARKGEDVSFLAKLADENSSIVTSAERAFVTRLNGGCSAPIAAFAEIENEKLILNTLYVDEKGRDFTQSLEGSPTKAEEIGIALAENILENIAE